MPTEDMTTRSGLLFIGYLLFAQRSFGQDVGAKELFYTPIVPAKSQQLLNGSKPKKADVKVPKWTSAPASTMIRNTGIKCQIELLEPSGNWSVVDARRSFYSGDRIRIHVESSVDGHLTILQKQDDGVPNVLYPSSKAQAGDGVVQAAKDYILPLYFDQSPGQIRLFFLL